MPLRSHLDILALNSLPLDRICAFSLSNDAEEQSALAAAIEQDYGMAGLRTLWMCQGLNCATRTVSVVSTDIQGLTKATQWWLTTQSDSAARLKTDFANVVSLEDANVLLGMGTRTPAMNMYSPESNIFFRPQNCEDTASLLWAVQVRRLAQTYFPHLPDVAQPFNHLYFQTYEVPEPSGPQEGFEESEWQNIYFDPMGAFIDDPHALKYFSSMKRPLPDNPPAWLVQFNMHGDAEWNMYKTLGISMAEAYTLAVANAHSQEETLCLPEHFDAEPSGEHAV